MTFTKGYFHNGDFENKSHAVRHSVKKNASIKKRK